VVSSTFDEPASRHVQVAEIVIEKARRLAESGRDVVILVDSITRLARAFHSVTPPSGRLLPGGVDPAAMQPVKRFFGTARNLSEGGSLTIIATAAADTGSTLDDEILDELEAGANCEIRVDRDLAEARSYPAIDVRRSATRQEERLLEADTLERIRTLRRDKLAGETAARALELARAELGVG
jgi:transcription termination factor Rho